MMDFRKIDVKRTEVKLGDKYLLKDRLGGGSFGQIFSAVNLENEARVAVKLEKRSVNATLIREAKVISDLRGHTGFPSLYDYGKEENYNYIVISLLGWNLEKLFKLCNQRFSLKTVLMIADQVLSRIDTLHDKSYIHRDIKPENFCIGKGTSSKNIFLIDFGLAKNYRDSNGEHIPMKEGKGLIGTARYASINAHLGQEQSRRDDLESIGYTLIYFLTGKLPWQNLRVDEKQQKYQKIAETKMKTPTELLCQGLPSQFLTYINYVRSLEFTEEPDYKFMKKLFRTLFVEYGYDFDYNYDWLEALKTQYSIDTTITPQLKIDEYTKDYYDHKAHNKVESPDLLQVKEVKQLQGAGVKEQNNIKTPTNVPSHQRSASRPTIILSDEKRGKGEEKGNPVSAPRKSVNLTSLPKINLIENGGKDEVIGSRQAGLPGSLAKNISSNSVYSSKNMNMNLSGPVGEDEDIPAELNMENQFHEEVGKVKEFNVSKRDISFKASEYGCVSLCKLKSNQNDSKTGLNTKRMPVTTNTLTDTRRNSARWVDSGKFGVCEEVIEGNLNESSICEWDERNNLDQLVNQKRFFV